MFAAGSDSIRIGLIGCGGRGTAAAQAAAAEGVFVTALGDLFPDQARRRRASSRPASARFACPATVGSGPPTPAPSWPRRRRGRARDAPHLRPRHVAAAVRAGLHVYCETPAGVDAAGVGPSSTSRPRPTRGAVVRGRSPLAARRRDRGDHRPCPRRAASAGSGCPGDEPRLACPRSGGAEPGLRPPRSRAATGYFRRPLERRQPRGAHVHVRSTGAIRALGDEPPIAAVAVPAARPLPSPPRPRWCRPRRCATIRRRPGARCRYRPPRRGRGRRSRSGYAGPSGQADLRRHDAATPNAHQACIAALVPGHCGRPAAWTDLA